MLYLGISNWNVKILLNIFKSSQSVKFWHHSLGKIKTLKYLDCLLAELSWYFSPVMANLIVKVEESTAVMKLSCMFWKSTNTEMMKVILFFFWCYMYWDHFTLYSNMNLNGLAVAYVSTLQISSTAFTHTTLNLTDIVADNIFLPWVLLCYKCWYSMCIFLHNTNML